MAEKRTFVKFGRTTFDVEAIKSMELAEFCAIHSHIKGLDLEKTYYQITGKKPEKKPKTAKPNQKRKKRSD